jgi:hypothetical protein
VLVVPIARLVHGKDQPHRGEEPEAGEEVAVRLEKRPPLPPDFRVGGAGFDVRAASARRRFRVAEFDMAASGAVAEDGRLDAQRQAVIAASEAPILPAS